MTAVMRGSTRVRLPARAPEVALRVGRRTVTLANLGKVFWTSLASPSAICCSTTPTSPPYCCRTCATARW